MNPLEIGTWLNYVYKRGYIDLTRLKKIPMCTMNPAKIENQGRRYNFQSTESGF